MTLSDKRLRRHEASHCPGQDVSPRLPIIDFLG
jgi:hypothetical protein